MPHLTTFALSLLCLTAFASAAGPGEIQTLLRDHLAPHPRLLLPAGGEKALADRLAADPRLAALRQRLLDDAAVVLTLPPLERKVEGGKRLLGVARDALHRIGTLSLAYRLTGDKQYLDGATTNLRTLVGFSDFHPAHFLDVAEISAALAIGYDWLYADLSPADRAAIKRAIVDKCLNASFMTPPDSWISGTNNWTQVCHGGLTLAALAIADEEPALATKVIRRAIENVPGGMKAYAPDGAFPEGANYWEYGTTYSCLMIAALQTAVGDDFGLSQEPGFLQSAYFHLHIVGPSMRQFSYCDGGEAIRTASAPQFFLASLQKRPDLLFNEVKLLDEHLKTKPQAKDTYGFDWLLAVWSQDTKNIPAPAATHWAGRGINPVALHRSAWTPQATFVGIHAGTPSSSHAHMDIGSFALDAGGVRWAGDLGMQDYNSLETRGLKIWDGGPDSDRWRVYRLGQWAHNILTVDGQPQVYAGHATIEKTGDDRTIINLSPVYAGQFSDAHRGVLLRPDGSVRVQDDIRAARPDEVKPASTRPATGPAHHPADPVTVRWAMLTTADVALAGGHATLTKNGKTLTAVVRSPAGATFAVESTDPPHDYDAPNPGTRLLTVHVPVNAGEGATIVVDFLPDGEGASDPVTPLAKW